jgi:hypothetical protein
MMDYNHNDLSSLITHTSDFDRIFTTLLSARHNPDPALESDHRLRSCLLDRLDDLTHRALVAKDADARLQYHRTIGAFLELKTTRHTNPLELSIYVNLIGNRLVQRWMDREISHISAEKLPKPGEDLVDWIHKTIETHSAPDHPLYTYIEQHADMAGFQYFLAQEQTVDAVFADLIALTQIGAAPSYKFEMGRNYWDEMGNGDPLMAHAKIFDNMFQRMDIHRSHDKLTEGALAGGNLLLALALHRCYHYRAIGALACTELAVVKRFIKVGTAARRLRLPEEVLHYYQLHVEADAEHADGWLTHVVRPLVQSMDSQEIASEIAHGVLLRLNVSQSYCDGVLDQLQSQAARRDVRN